MHQSIDILKLKFNFTFRNFAKTNQNQLSQDNNHKDYHLVSTIICINYKLIISCSWIVFVYMIKGWSANEIK
jgi:hypothetical protein